MGNVINLNKFRKRKAKVQRVQRADVNRRLHGRTKAERAKEELQKRQLTRQLDGARLEGEASKRAQEDAPDSEPPSSGVE